MALSSAPSALPRQSSLDICLSQGKAGLVALYRLDLAQFMEAGKDPSKWAIAEKAVSQDTTEHSQQGF